ncbi:MAG TPA: hypothetical protein DIS66_05745 [Candidatus Omnitrophica bacterium]|nr:hypothetical protein [Candidatus Omnitrophota bacterium]
MRFVCVFTTAPQLTFARKLAGLLIEKKLAACVTLIPSVESHYFWKGKKEKSREVQLIIKTTQKQFKKIERFFKKNHPYEVPELIGLPVLSASKNYSSWILSVLSDD